MRRKTVKQRAIDWKTEVSYLIMLSPFFVLFFIFILLPVGASVGLSLFHYDTVSEPHFIGLENYLRMFMDDEAFLTGAEKHHTFCCCDRSAWLPAGISHGVVHQ